MIFKKNGEKFEVFVVVVKLRGREFAFVSIGFIWSHRTNSSATKYLGCDVKNLLDHLNDLASIKRKHTC